jgi:hypothetical protein
MKEISVSTTDPDAGLFYKDERERMFCYSYNTACDRNGFVLANVVSSGNIHDSVNFDKVFVKVKERFNGIKALSADAGYLTPHICRDIIVSGVRPVLPYKRPMTKKGFFRKQEYVYDEYYDVYICPNDKLLKYSTTDRNGYKIYRSNPEECKNCPYLLKCTGSKKHQKIVTRHVWAAYQEESDHLRHTPENREIYALRSQTIERVFADLKEKHGMRYTNYRGKGRVTDEAMMVLACMNLKKMANWKWKRAA